SLNDPPRAHRYPPRRASSSLFPYPTLFRSRPAHRYKLLGGLTLLIGLPSAWSLYRYSTYAEHPNPSDVVVVQPNIDPYGKFTFRSEEHTSELQSRENLVCRLLLEKKTHIRL